MKSACPSNTNALRPPLVFDVFVHSTKTDINDIYNSFYINLGQYRGTHYLTAWRLHSVNHDRYPSSAMARSDYAFAAMKTDLTLGLDYGKYG